MMKPYLLLLLLVLIPVQATSALMINEIACGTAGDDWVELFLYDTEDVSMDISGLYVTMYYGTNEPLAVEPVTLCSRDRPETPYDDRYAVVHLTSPITDETDLTGDTNHNGYIDLYCNNYSGSLWNSDGIVAIDIDDDPGNGGIIDFCAYSNRDGSLNETIMSYILDAQGAGQWTVCGEPNLQLCLVPIDNDGLASHMSIIRTRTNDTNGPDDFTVTTFQTPGRDNIGPINTGGNTRLFSSRKKKITFVPSHPTLGTGKIDLFVYNPCNIRFKIFTSVGLCIFESPLYRDVFPGEFSIPWDFRGRGRRASSGFYIGRIEGTSTKLKKQETSVVYIIVSRYGR